MPNRPVAGDGGDPSTGRSDGSPSAADSQPNVTGSSGVGSADSGSADSLDPFPTPTGYVGLSELLCRDDRPRYRCPGESRPITRAVHLARLAAGYAACHECSHRQDTGLLLPQLLRKVATPSTARSRGTLLDARGMNGTYLNEIDRRVARRLAERFAWLLWEDRPLRWRASGPQTLTGRRPVVLVGHDHRASSLDLAMGVTAGLIRMSCRVLELGPSLRAECTFAVQHLNADAAVYVGGNETAPRDVRFVLLGGRGIPLDTRAIERLSRIWDAAVSRPLRTAGERERHSVRSVYVASLRKHFHALRPLRVLVGFSSRLLPPLLRAVFAELPCDVVLQSVPRCANSVRTPTDPGRQAIASGVRRHRAHLGILIDDDAEQAAVVDDRGEPVSPEELAVHIADVEAGRGTHSRIVVPEPRVDRLCVSSGLPRQALIGSADGSRSGILLAVDRHQAAFGLDEEGGFAFPDPLPRVDAVVVLAHVLRRLSLTDRPFSDLRSTAGMPRVA
ncbi:MAG: hypothetical protein D6725_16360 [Planctomycetota bacterium]|nr:MAG: hypothetical protein D6725_16360 [Planctomycetota bacterium]